MKTQLNLLAFLLGLSLAFPLCADAVDCVMGEMWSSYATCTVTIDSGGLADVKFYTWGDYAGSYNNINYTNATTGETCLEYWGAYNNIWKAGCSEYGFVDPISWTDGVKNEDEAGIDCGGDNPEPCVDVCGFGSELYDGVCRVVTEPNDLGVCPDDYSSSFDYETGTSSCSAIVGYPVPMSSALAGIDPADYEVELGVLPAPEPVPAPVYDSSVTSETSNVYSETTDPDGTVTIVEGSTFSTYDSGSNITEEVESTTTTVIAPDGSKVETIVTDKTEIDQDGTGGSSSSTTIINTYDSDGNLVSSTESTSNSDSEDPATAGSYTAKTVGEINFQPFLDLKDKVGGHFPFSLTSTVADILSQFDVTPSAPSWDIAFPNPWGSSYSVVIDLAPMQSIATIIRNLLSIFVLLCGFYMIYKRWI